MQNVSKTHMLQSSKIATVVGEGRGGRTGARQHPGQAAETSGVIQALLSRHIPAFPMGSVLFRITADGSLPLEDPAQSCRNIMTPINTRMFLKTR